MAHLSALVAVLLALATVLPMVRPGRAYGYAGGTQTEHAAAAYLVNRARLRHELPKFSGSARLHDSAQVEAARVHRYGFSHTPGGVSWTMSLRPWTRHCRTWSAGEALGHGYMSPRGVVDAWLASPEHRRILLSSSFRRVGVAHHLGVWVLHAGVCR